MPWYSANTSNTIETLRNDLPSVKQVWLAEDSAGAGTIASLFSWFKCIVKEGQKYGYIVNGSKSWLITKSESLANEAKLIFREDVNITCEGKRHLGAVIGSKIFKDTFCEEKIANWRAELETLAEIAKNQPQSAYVAFTKGFKNKFTYFMRTIDSFEDYMNPIDEIIDETLLPVLFGQVEPLPSEISQIVKVPPSLGGLGMPNLKEESPQQYAASKAITACHVESIRTQSSIVPPEAEVAKKQQQSLKSEKIKSKVEEIDASLPQPLLRQVAQARDKGASSWLNAIPYENQGLVLNKQEFRDALRLRYNMPLSDLPQNCPCGSSFNVNHALSCKKGGFDAQKHDNVRDFLTMLLSKVCHNVQAEPLLIPLNGEHFDLKSTTTSQDAQSKCNQNKTTSSIFKEQEQENKRKYQQRVLDVEMVLSHL